MPAASLRIEEAISPFGLAFLDFRTPLVREGDPLAGGGLRSGSAP
jgi:hypothetical protein